MLLTDLDRTLRAAGLAVEEVDGWKTRGHGQLNGVRTITVHHTANGGAAGNTPSLNTVIKGRGGVKPLKGPLSQLFLARDGTWYVVASGVAWHAGVSRENRYTNLWALGIEAEAVGVPGTKSDWPEVQMVSYARGCRALIERYGLVIGDIRGHKETCAPEGRKSDPSFSMPAFRLRVSAVDLTQEDNMALSPEDIAKIAKAVATYDIPNKTPGSPDTRSTLGGTVVDIERTQDGDSKTLAALKVTEALHHTEAMTAIANLTTAVQALANRLPST